MSTFDYLLEDFKEVNVYHNSDGITISYNFYSNVSSFEKSIKRHLTLLELEVNEELLSLETKYERLIKIKLKKIKVKELKSLFLIKGENYTHSNFSKSNPNSKITEELIQEYYKTALLGIKKMIKILKAFEKALLKSDEFSKKETNRSKQIIESSSELHPLKYFYNSIINKKYNEFKSYFFSDMFIGYNIIEVNKDTEIVEYEIFISPVESQFVQVKFEDILKSELQREYINTLGLVQERIAKLNDELGIILYLKLCINSLEFIHKSIKSYEGDKSYDHWEAVLLQLVKSLYNRYERFLKDIKRDGLVKKSLEFNTELFNEKGKENLLLNDFSTCFNWTEKKHERTAKLYELLMAGGYISNDTEEEVFSRIFTSTNIQDLGIKWTGKVKGKISLPLLRFMFHLLSKRGLLTINWVRFDSMLPLMFKRGDGKPFNYIKGSKSQISKRKMERTVQERELDNCLATLA